MEKISRTQKKKVALARQKLGERLIAMPEEQMTALNLPHELAEAITMARGMTRHEARRRQIQYVGKLMRHIDPDEIEAALQSQQAQEALGRRKFQWVEKWRDELADGNRERLSWLISRFSDLDSQQLTQLVRQAQHAKGTTKGRQTSRLLFRYLMKTLPDTLE